MTHVFIKEAGIKLFRYNKALSLNLTPSIQEVVITLFEEKSFSKLNPKSKIPKVLEILKLEVISPLRPSENSVSFLDKKLAVKEKEFM